MNKDVKWPLLIFAIGVFMAALDNGIMTSALTTLTHAFGVTPTWGTWTMTLYTLGMAISVPIVGKFSDRYGRKRLFLIEIGLFGFGSLLVALSPNFVSFLAARFIQSLGGGGIFIIASSYVLSTFPKERQGRALGMIGGMHGIASVLGPNIGALILSLTGSWHWLFLINLPIAAILFALGTKHLQEGRERVATRTDWIGIVILTGAIFSFMYSVTTLDGGHVSSSLLAPSFLAWLGAGVLLFVALWRYDKRAPRRAIDPILPTDMLRGTAFRLTLLLGLFSGAILGAVIFIPGYVEQFLHVDAAMSGFWFTPLALAAGVGAAGGGHIIDWKGPIASLTAAASSAVIGFALFPLWVEVPWQMVVASCFVGLGFGAMLGAPLNVLATERTERDKGIALATLSLVRQIGMAIAPTFYAGFLARSFVGIGTTVREHLSASSRPVPLQLLEQLSGANDFQSLTQLLEKTPDPHVKAVLEGAIDTAVRQGFNGLFYAALTISILAFVTIGILARVRKKQSRQLAERTTTPRVT